MQSNNLSEYIKLQDELRAIQDKLQKEDDVQANLRQQIVVFYDMLKENFSKKWPPLKERKVE